MVNSGFFVVFFFTYFFTFALYLNYTALLYISCITLSALIYFSFNPNPLPACVCVFPATFGKFLSRRIFVTIRPVLLIKAFFSAF